MISNDQLAMIIGSFLLANAASVAVAVKWVFNHALEYQLLKSKVSQIETVQQQHVKDIKAAHDKLRGSK